MGKKSSLIRDFATILLKWDTKENKRKMPWKGEKNPYKIWLSEIILQQTRVEQGWAYYTDFVNTFPDIKKLASAKEEKVYKLWEGLGYYSRCRNLIATARYISNVCKGQFPDTYTALLNLKGVGPYTAAAIASFAYNLPYAVVDGNVFRVLARVFGISKAIDTTDGRKYFTAMAQELLDKKEPGRYNQAMMDFGAVICKPANPLCSECVFQKECKAFRFNQVAELPVKSKKTITRQRWFYYLAVEYDSKVLIRKRTAKDIWQDLHEFVLVETERRTAPGDILQIAADRGLISRHGAEIKSASPELSQQLSHQKITGRLLRVDQKKPLIPPGFQWVPVKKVKKLAFPRFINSLRQEIIN